MHNQTHQFASFGHRTLASSQARAAMLCVIGEMNAANDSRS